MLTALLFHKSNLQLRGLCCDTLPATEDNISKFNVRMYDFKRQEAEAEVMEVVEEAGDLGCDYEEEDPEFAWIKRASSPE